MSIYEITFPTLDKKGAKILHLLSKSSYYIYQKVLFFEFCDGHFTLTV